MRTTLLTLKKRKAWPKGPRTSLQRRAWLKIATGYRELAMMTQHEHCDFDWQAGSPRGVSISACGPLALAALRPDLGRALVQAAAILSRIGFDLGRGLPNGGEPRVLALAAARRRTSPHRSASSGS